MSKSAVDLFNEAPDAVAEFDAAPEAIEPPMRLDDSAVPLGPGSTGAMHFARHLSGGLGDKMAAGALSLSDFLADRTGKSFGDIYGRNLGFLDRTMEASDRENPVSRWVGNAFGFGGSLAALAAAAPARAALAARGIVPAAQAVPATTSALIGGLRGLREGAKVGSALGAVGGYGASRGHELRDLLLGAGFGGLMGGTLGALGGAGSALFASRARPQPQTLGDLARQAGTPETITTVAAPITPTQEAMVLQRHGVPLTLGRMEPGGWASEAEEAALRVPGLRKTVTDQWAATEDAWRNAALNEARSPVPGALRPGNTMEKLQGIKQDFATAYDDIAQKPAAALAKHPETGELVHPREAFGSILNDSAYQAPDSDLGVVGRVFNDQLSALERAQQAGEPVKAGLLMKVREGLREAAQVARESENFARAKMFQDAAEAVTGGIRGTIPARFTALLDKTDAAYANYMKVMGAAKRAARNVNEGEFMPQHLKGEMIQSYGRKFVEDPKAGGTLRELATAGHAVFSPRMTMTGHGESLFSKMGQALAPAVLEANQNPSTQAAIAELARRIAERGVPMSRVPAGAVERALGSALDVLPPASYAAPAGASTLADLLGRGRGRQ